MRQGVVRGHRGARQFRVGEAEPTLLDGRDESLLEARLHILQEHAVLRALRARKAGLDSTQIQIERVGERRLGAVVGTEQSLRSAISLGELGLIDTVRALEIAQRLGVDREEADRRAVFRRHVRDRGAIRQRHGRQAGAEELDELVDDALLPQHLRDREHEVGRGDTIAQLPRELEADHLRREHVERLPQHDGLGLDPADAPAHDAQPIDHGGVRVGAHDRVRVRDQHAAVLRRERGAGQILEIHLVHDAGRRRHDAEVRERLLAPAQELVALLVALELDLGVLLERGRGAEVVDLHRVIDHEVDRDQWVDALGIGAHAFDGFPHRGQIDHARHTREVLQDHTRRLEWQFDRLGTGGLPVREPFHVVLCDLIAVAMTKRGLEQHADRERELREVDAEFRGERAQRVDVDGADRRDERLANAEGVAKGCVHDASFPVRRYTGPPGKTGRRTGPPVNHSSLQYRQGPVHLESAEHARYSPSGDIGAGLWPPADACYRGDAPAPPTPIIQKEALMKTLRSRSLLLLAATLLVSALAGCKASNIQTTPIRTLLDDPSRFDKQTVRIAGTVTRSLGILGYGAYEVEDGTGKIPVATQSNGAPRVGAKVGVEGEFRSAFTIGTTTMAAIVEKRRVNP